MIFFYLIFILLFIIGIRLSKDNKDYLSKESTTIINGLFVITIFFSHFRTYITNLNTYDNYLITILNFLGQLMVTSFLFYSGYGIYESIKNKKDYMKSFFIKRFIPTLVNFMLAICLFILVNIVLGNKYSIATILLSFTGYTSIGNSNWYMLAIFILYIFIMILFNEKIKIKNIYKIVIITILTCIYIYIITRFKDLYYADTILCFPIGMLYSYYKDKIEKIVSKKYYLYLIISVLFFIGMYFINKNYSNVYISNLYAISFILLLVFISMKFKFKSKIMYFLGTYTFWIYILQRIPMMLLKDKFNNYLYLVICFIITIILSYIMKLLTDKLWKKKG